MATITELQKKVVKALETGQDPAPILKELAELRTSIAMEAEKAELQKIVDKRKALQDRAEEVKAKIQKQNEAIDTLLKARDSIVEALLPIVNKAKELPNLHDKCFEEFHDGVQAGYITHAAGGFLPADLTIPMLQLGNGERDIHAVSKEAVMYLYNAYGLLANLQKIETKPQQPSIDPELDFGDDHSEITEANCLVCTHKDVEAINKGLKEGRPLRDLEAAFNVSRSTLSRHKNHCLDLSAIRITEPISA
ncbi:MAG: hypothetical protein ABSF21_00635 [Dehalococcoidia bacterium]